MFVTWYTFDSERPEHASPVPLGDLPLDDMRLQWLTAYGPYEGQRAVLEVGVTPGGPSGSPLTDPMLFPEGSLTVTFNGCTAATMEFDLPNTGYSAGRHQGVIPIRRVALENVPLCEVLNDL